jgi:hypothetical protein
MAGLHRLISESPNECGIALAGREHFFDSEEERKRALGQTTSWKNVRLDEFTNEQIAELVKQYGFRGEIPSWVPARPLLLTTLFARDLSPAATMELTSIQDPASGWDILLDEVCSREARIEKSGVSGENVRAILEALATLARCKDGGMGPLSTDDIVGAFQTECGFTPADEALIVLQRLPGLGKDAAVPESRSFVDVEFADACRAGDFHRFCADPFNSTLSQRLSKTVTIIGDIGIGVAAAHLRKMDFQSGNVTAAIKALDRIGLAARGATPADVLSLSIHSNLEVAEALQVSKLQFDHFELTGERKDLARVVFEECYLSSLELGPNTTGASCPRFQKCLIEELDGRTSANDLPNGCFIDCEIERFLSSTETNTSAFALDVPSGVKVLVSILKKLFVQSLSGRKEEALFRGMDAFHSSKVPQILSILQTNGLVTRSERSGDKVWIPVRRLRPRAFMILTSPSTSKDPVVVQARTVAKQ